MKRFLSALGLAALLTGCGSTTVEGPLDNEEKLARLQGCNKAWRAEGFNKIVSQPIVGRVDQLTFERLSSNRKKRLAEVLACQRSNGAVEPLTIEFLSRDRRLQSIKASNNIDFAGEYGTSKGN